MGLHRELVGKKHNQKHLETPRLELDLIYLE